MSNPIRIQISKSTGDVTHIDEQGRKTVVRGRGRNMNARVVRMELEGRGLRTKKQRQMGVTGNVIDVIRGMGRRGR